MNNRTHWKETIWTELDASRCEVVARSVGPETGTLYGLKIRHPNLPRPRFFQVSRAGNLYARSTGVREELNRYANGYIIKNWEALAHAEGGQP